MMGNTYRKGALGALIDEYERAVLDLKHLVERIPEDDFARIVDPQTLDENCRSVQTIMRHVLSSGYGYANHIRQRFAVPSTSPPSRLYSHQEVMGQLVSMIAYTAQTVEGKWEMADEEIEATTMEMAWGVSYNLEQLLEHAIVHILRHRRQIEKFMRQGALALRLEA